MGTTTPNFNFYKPSIGETTWGALVNANWDVIDANLTNALPRAYLAGCQLSNDGASPTTKIDITAGQAQDAGNAGAMTLASTLIKDISAVWAVGSGNGGLAAALSPRTINTWYHLFLMKRTDTGVVDAYFDTSVTAANIPSPYTLFRRLGSVKTDGSNNLLAFVQDGDYVRWKASVLDVNTTNPGTAAVTATLAGVPTGVNVQALLNVIWNPATSGTGVQIYLSDLAANDEAPGILGAPGASGISYSSAPVTTGFSLLIRTNTSAQLRYRVSASGVSDNVKIVTLGWTDTRGRNA